MSLFSSIQLASNSLRAAQIGLQVVGQNIANVNTPGYIREEVFLAPAATQQIGDLSLGLGVDVKGIVQKVDEFLEQRLRSSRSDVSSAEVQEHSYRTLEGLIGELTDTDLSTSLNNFINSIHEVLNQPESVSVRNLAVLQGQTLAGDISRLGDRVAGSQEDLNQRIINIAGEINRLTKDVRDLNVRIVEVEGGGLSNSDAVGLRDQRQLALTELSKLIDIEVREQPSGAVSLIVGGDYLVLEGERREVEAKLDSVDGLPVASVQIIATRSDLDIRSGELAGLITARDQILTGFLHDLDDLSKSLIFEFNKVYSQGQGISGFDQITSEFGVNETDLALDAAGLPFSPVNGSFQVQVFNEQTGLTKTTDIYVDLNGMDEDTSLDDIVAALDAIEGLSASTTLDGKLVLDSDSPDQTFAFANDTSGVLAALGVNTFFSGRGALDMGVQKTLLDDPAKFAASLGGVGSDSSNAINLASFLDKPLETQNGSTILVTYDRLVGGITQGSTVAHSVAEGFRGFRNSLEAEQLSVSGVSLDEEAIRMIQFQRAFQASARYISIVDELLGVLISI
jgi:flagellar hook-associated protein 1 FlgK